MRTTLTLLFLTLTTLLIAQHWQVDEMASMPERVSNNAVCEGFINGAPYVYSFAGIDSTKIYSGIHLRSFRYSVNDNSWEVIPPLPDDMGGKIAASANRIGDIIYIIGGYHVFSNGSETSSDKVHRYDVVNNTYLPDGAPIPVPIDDQTQAVWRDSLIYVITGWSDFGNVRDVQIYNPAADEWLEGTPTPNSHDYKSFGSTGVIIGDTIYYFGGAQSTGNFPIQTDFRIGIINPEDPTEIEWSLQALDPIVNGYRMAAGTSKGKAFWIGGSGVTYNYNGIAYNGSGGVPPINRSLFYEPETGYSEADFSNNFPMDFRNMAEINDTVKYLVGGMIDNQLVTNKTWRLDSDVAQISATTNLKTIHFEISPNPVNSLLQVVLPAHMNSSSYQIFDAQGVTINQGALIGSTIDVAHLVSGVYFIKISNSTEAGYRLFVKM